MVDTFAGIISFLAQNLIRGMFISVLLIILVKYLSNDRIETRISFQIACWLIVSYSFGAIISSFLLLLFEHSDAYDFLDRATGPYWWAYYLMLFFNAVLPLALLNHKMGRKAAFLFAIALLMNLGWLFESFVIHMTSLQQNIPENYNPYLPNATEIRIIANGIYAGIFILIIGNGIKIWRTKRSL